MEPDISFFKQRGYKMINRIEQLDSLRGLAALAVLFSHIPFFAFSFSDAFYKILELLGFTSGHKSVMLFFLLSGFVLSLPFLQEKEINYTSYAVKRIFRIYVPYIIAITFAIILSQIFLVQNVGVVRNWDLLWSTPISIKVILEHILFLGDYYTNAFNGVIWSLIHELRISLVFPFVVLLIKRFKWKGIIVICLILTGISVINNIYHFQVSSGYNTSYFKTLEYLVLFILGSLIAKHKNILITFFRKSNLFVKWLFLFISLFLFNFSGIFLGYVFQFITVDSISSNYSILSDYGIALGCMGIMISAISSIKLERVLLLKPLLFLGKISYSLYLYHLPIILSCIYLFNQMFPLWVISLLAIPLSLFVSTAAWYLIEKPSHRWARELGKRISNKKSISLLRKKTV